jgi:hypothetical protein
VRVAVANKDPYTHRARRVATGAGDKPRGVCARRRTQQLRPEAQAHFTHSLQSRLALKQKQRRAVELFSWLVFALICAVRPQVDTNEDDDATPCPRRRPDGAARPRSW